MRTTNTVVLIGKLASNADSCEAGIVLYIETGEGSSLDLHRVNVRGALSREAIMLSCGDLVYVEGRLRTVNVPGAIFDELKGASDVEAVFVKKLGPREVLEGARVTL
jgi:hypothetical protein